MGNPTNEDSSAFLRFVPNSLAVSVAAGRRIEAGEEITVSCKPHHLDVTDMRAQPWSTYELIETFAFRSQCGTDLYRQTESSGAMGIQVLMRPLHSKQRRSGCFRHSTLADPEQKRTRLQSVSSRKSREGKNTDEREKGVDE